MTVQSDIFGNVHAADIPVVPTARRIMREKPVTFNSHRLLMREVARAIGAHWIDRLDSEQKAQLDRLMDLSPDFERAARNIRNEAPEPPSDLGM